MKRIVRKGVTSIPVENKKDGNPNHCIFGKSIKSLRKRAYQL